MQGWNTRVLASEVENALARKYKEMIDRNLILLIMQLAVAATEAASSNVFPFLLLVVLQLSLWISVNPVKNCYGDIENIRNCYILL